MDEELKFKLRIIDHYCTFQYLLQYRSSEYIELYPDSYTPGSTVFCPFHENTDTKAAKLYDKDFNDKTNEGFDSERLYCFAENRLYFPHSLLTPPKDSEYNLSYKFKSIIPYTPQWVFNAIWNNLPNEDKEYWKSTTQNSFSIKQDNNSEPLYCMYRKGKISLFSLLSTFKNS